MSDVHSPEIRSYNMSQIKGKGTKPEELVRKYLFSKGFRYRKNSARLPGKPDIVLPKYKTVIFVNGCFWHKHEGCKYFVWPKNNAEFWRAKIEGNAERDAHNYEQLAKLGWKVLIVWECELKKNVAEGTLKKIVQNLQGECYE
jgi:DNA mismatch endonuclease (patch repair protein)